MSIDLLKIDKNALKFVEICALTPLPVYRKICSPQIWQISQIESNICVMCVICGFSYHLRKFYFVEFETVRTNRHGTSARDDWINDL